MKVAACVFLASVVLSGCAGQSTSPTPTQGSNVRSYEAPGNLESAGSVGCVKIESLEATNTPADIFPGVRECIDLGEYEKAAALFAYAGAYGRYDMARVKDSTARQAITVLRMNNLGSVPKESQAAFQVAAEALFKEGSASFQNLCTAMKASGAPEYYPTYMIQHGMSAFVGGGGLKEGFEASQGWSEVMNSYMKCPPSESDA